MTSSAFFGCRNACGFLVCPSLTKASYAGRLIPRLRRRCCCLHPLTFPLFACSFGIDWKVFIESQIDLVWFGTLFSRLQNSELQFTH